MISKNIRLFKIDSFLGGLWPMAAVLPVYFEEITKSYTLAMAVFSVASVTQALTEIPAGVYSDKIGRKGTLQLSAAVIFLSFLFWAAAGNMNSVLFLFAGAVCWGISDSFISGTLDALMYETVEENGDKGGFDRIYVHSNALTQLGVLTGMAVAVVVVYFFSLQVLAWISVLPVLGQLYVARSYVEPKKKRPASTVGTETFKSAVKAVLNNKKLFLFSVIEVVDTSIGMANHRFESLYFARLIPVWTINIARAVKDVCGALSFSIVSRFRRFSKTNVWAGSVLATIAVDFIAVVVNGSISPFLIALSNLFYGAGATVKSSLLQKEFSADQRAATGSVLSLTSSLATAVFLLLLGAVADTYSVRVAVCVGICAKLAVALLCAVAFKKYR